MGEVLETDYYVNYLSQFWRQLGLFSSRNIIMEADDHDLDNNRNGEGSESGLEEPSASYVPSRVRINRGFSINSSSNGLDEESTTDELEREEGLAGCFQPGAGGNSILNNQTRLRKLSTVSFGIGVDSSGIPVRRFSCIPPNLNLDRRISHAPPVQKKPAVVVVRDGKKTYGSNAVPVINGFNMTVEEGSIYALLGSSGCGKTTILSCIVGIRSLDSGVVYVFGNRPDIRGSTVLGKNLGYMPQDLSLYDDFTIKETLNYFGSLYCLPASTISENRKWLVEFLAMPDPNRRVGGLSGGQKRRVSMALAMIHNPSLLILDEPTVGVDPLLRESIWKHLVERATKHNTTIIITTHYIEEAKKSNMIGVMRNGKLLAEQTPEDLMEEHKASLLEDVVMKLCKKDTDETQNPENMSAVRRKAFELQADFVFPTSNVPDKRPILATTEEGSVGSSVFDSIKRILALARKNAMFLMRNQLLLFFILLAPSMVILLLGTTFGREPESIDFGIVNHELEAHNVTNCKALLTLPRSSYCDPLGLSCRFMKHIPEELIKPKHYPNEGDALYAVQRGKVWGYMSFPQNFSEAFHTKVISPPEDDPSLLEEVLEGASIKVEMDQTSQSITAAVKRKFRLAFDDFTSEFQFHCLPSNGSSSGNIPLRFADPIIGSDGVDTKEFVAPGLTIAFPFFYPMVFTAIQFILEKKLGTLERAFVAGVKTWEIMAGFSITITFVLLASSVLTLVIMKCVTDVAIQGSFFLCILLGLFTGLAGVAMGFILGSICKDEVECAFVALSMFFPLTWISGVMWPIQGMSKGFYYFSYFLPVQMPAEAMRSIVSRGWGLEHSHVYSGFLILIGFGILFWLITITIHRKNWAR